MGFIGWLRAGYTILKLIVGAVNATEEIVTEAKGMIKENSAVAIVHGILHETGDPDDRDALNDPTVNQKVRNVMKAVVDFQNTVRDWKRAKSGD